MFAPHLLALELTGLLLQIAELLIGRAGRPWLLPVAARPGLPRLTLLALLALLLALLLPLLLALLLA
ncbi:MAG: hypothetical protein KA190_21855, partial [Kofleriaceae bacterium]|nr:hypothetical protein [Kofleriaceae bacterium]